MGPWGRGGANLTFKIRNPGGHKSKLLIPEVIITAADDTAGCGDANQATKSLSTATTTTTTTSTTATSTTQGGESMSQRMQLLMMTGTKKVGICPNIGSADQQSMIFSPKIFAFV